MAPDMEEDRSSFLAITHPLEQDLQLPERDRDAAQAIAAGLLDAKAANTHRAYDTAWQGFQAWADASGRQSSLPATPQAVALYLGRLAANGKAMATIEQARAAISHFHAAAGMQKGDNPARHPVVAEAMKGWRNQAPAPRQADALTADALAHVRETARLPRRGRRAHGDAGRGPGPGSRGPGNHRSDGRWRSEGAARPWGDVAFWPDGTARITIQKGKNQPEPATVASPRAPPAPCAKSSPTGADPATPVRRWPTGASCGQGRRPGRRLFRTQRQDRHGAPDGGRESADRSGSAPGAVEAR